MTIFTFFIVLLFIIVVVTILAGVKTIPQSYAGIVERFGKYRITLGAGLKVIVPFFDRVAYKIDLREQVVAFPPQPVITEDNLVVSIDSVIYFQVNDPFAATYEVANYIHAIEQLTIATLRNIIGKMSLETALTSRDTINSGLRGELDSATGKWGIRVSRVELKSIDPPGSIIDAMEKQMRAERDKRANILEAEGNRQSAILNAEGAKQAAILNAEAAKTSAILTSQARRESYILEAEGERQSKILRAQGESQAILAVSQAIHDGNPDQKLLAFKYLETLPKIAEGQNASTWVVPAELTKFLNSFTNGVGSTDSGAIIPADGGGVAEEHRINMAAFIENLKTDETDRLTGYEVDTSRAQVPLAQVFAEKASGVQKQYEDQKEIDLPKRPTPPYLADLDDDPDLPAPNA
jgi:regulator of protease activity HflC (stomatin/prohibitin superfamily)